MKTIDVRNLPCPQPVIHTRRAMEQRVSLCILISNPDQADNVTRMAESSGWTCKLNHQDDHLELYLTPGESVKKVDLTSEDIRCATSQRTVSDFKTLVISSEFMGRGDDALGKILMKAFVNTLKECSARPDTIVFFNSGVKLTVTGSPVLESLKQLASGGVDILVCGTCLEYYNLKEVIEVGTVSNMYDIAETMLATGVAYIG